MTTVTHSCPLLDLIWESFAQEAGTALDTRKFGEAEVACSHGWEIAQSFYQGDPRQAASLNNLAVCFHSVGNLPEAQRLYLEALEAWKQTANWIAEMKIQLRAHSVSFHLRLEAKHRDNFAALRRINYERLADAGKAVTGFNLGKLLVTMNRQSDAEPLYQNFIEIWPTAIGARDEALATVCENLAALYEFSGCKRDADPLRARAQSIRTELSSPRRIRFISEKGITMTDERKLKAAAYLAALLH